MIEEQIPDDEKRGHLQNLVKSAGWKVFIDWVNREQDTRENSILEDDEINEAERSLLRFQRKAINDLIVYPEREIERINDRLSGEEN